MIEQNELNERVHTALSMWTDPKPPKTIDPRDLAQIRYSAISALLTGEPDSLSRMIKDRALPKGLAEEVAFFGVATEIPRMRAYFRKHSGFLQEVVANRMQGMMGGMPGM